MIRVTLQSYTSDDGFKGSSIPSETAKSEFIELSIN